MNRLENLSAVRILCGVLLIIFAFILLIVPATGPVPAATTGLSDRNIAEIIAGLAGVGLLFG